MMRWIGPLVFGVGGVAILMSLGFWQLARLDWKLGVIADITNRIQSDPVPVPAAPDPEADQYLPVFVSGRFTGDRVHVLSSLRGSGPGSRVIAVLETTDGRRLLVDRGFVAEAAEDALDYTAESAEIVGNLQWPSDTDSYTPDPDLGRNLWFSRNVAPIADHLGTEAVMVVARYDSSAPAELTPTPVSPNIKNDHLGYAYTWFSLAAVWVVMTAALLWRIRRDRA